MKKVIVRRVRYRRAATPKTVTRRNGICLKDEEIKNNFSPAMLDLGDLSKPCREIEAIAAIFDLSGFTRFCNQVDAYLEIPRFFSEFLDWFFTNVRKGLTESRRDGNSKLWAELPIIVKFMGDGILLLWNARGIDESRACQIVAMLYDVCNSYRRAFYPEISLHVNKPPAVLRCGIARGKVFSLGDGRDYIGHCINNASRLSHIGALSFCFPHRGFRVREHMLPEYARLFIPKTVNIRGIGEEETIWVVGEEYEKLSLKDKALFHELDNIFI